MYDLREHKELISQLVSEANQNDENWRWSVKSVGKTKARIFWSYLEYCGQPEPYFVIELEDTGDGYWIHALRAFDRIRITGAAACLHRCAAAARC